MLLVCSLILFLELSMWKYYFVDEIWTPNLIPFQTVQIIKSLSRKQDDTYIFTSDQLQFTYFLDQFLSFTIDSTI